MISDGVDKGLLSDGQNIMKNGLETSNVEGGTKLVKDISYTDRSPVICTAWFYIYFLAAVDVYTGSEVGRSGSAGCCYL